MKPNILFINLPSIPYEDLLKGFEGKSMKSYPLSMPMGILYLSSFIKKFNKLNKVKILDYPLNIKNISDYTNIEEFISGIAKRDVSFIPDILVFSIIFSTAHPFFNTCINILKEIWPNSIAIAGGTHATNCTAKLLENKNLDYLGRGEGEIQLSSFIKQYPNIQNDSIDGIYSKKNIVPNSELKLGESILNLDEQPFPDWELIDMESYITSRGRKRELAGAIEKKFATITTNRGCPFKCTFCSAHTVHGRKMRYRSVENIIEEVKYLYENYCVTLFIPEDDMFTIPKARIIKLLSELKDLNIPNFELQLPSALSINTLDEEVMDALIGASMNIATLAIESGSTYVQKHVIKKNCNLKKAKQIVKYLKNKGLIVRCYFILGFFGETKEQMQETIEYVKALGADWCVFNIAAPLVGSEMYNQLVEAGCISDDVGFWSKSFFTERSFDTPEVSAADLKELTYRANLDCNFIHNINKISGNYEKAIDIYTDIVRAYPFHIIGWYCIMECYEGLGNLKKAKEIKTQIFNLIKNDKQAEEMYLKYNDLIPKFIYDTKEVTQS